MKIKIKGLNLYDSVIGKIFSVTLWCLIISEIAFVHTYGELALSCLYGIIFCSLFWLATCIFAIVRNKPLPAMPEKAKDIVEIINPVLFLYFIVGRVWPVIVPIWVTPIIWALWLSVIILTIKRRA